MKTANRIMTVVELASLLILTGCIPYGKSIPEPTLSRSELKLLTSVDKRAFHFSEQTKSFVDPDGVRINDFLSQITGQNYANIQFVSHSQRAEDEAAHIIQNIQGTRFRKISLVRKSSASTLLENELNVEILRYGYLTHRCRTEGRNIPFGCSVEINRVLSFAYPEELEFSSRLGTPSGANEHRIFRKFLQGDRPHLLGVEK